MNSKKITILLPLLSMVIIGCRNDNKVIPKNWQYTTEDDKIRNGVSQFAICESENVNNIEEPYGEIKQSIVLRNTALDGFRVLFTLSGGQYYCTDKCYVDVKFDSSSIIQYEVEQTIDHSSDVYLLKRGKEMDFLYRLKRAKQIMIETDYFNNGKLTFEFNSENFDWLEKGRYARNFLFNEMLYSDSAKIIKEAIDSGMDPTKVSKQAEGTPLIAAAGKNVELVNVLLNTGKYGPAELNAKDSNGYNAIMSASIAGSEAIINRLLKTGKFGSKELNEKNHSGETATKIAKDLGHPKVVKILKEAGASAN